MGAEEEGTATRRGDSEEGEGAPSRGQQLHVPACVLPSHWAVKTLLTGVSRSSVMYVFLIKLLNSHLVIFRVMSQLPPTNCFLSGPDK